MTRSRDGSTANNRSLLQTMVSIATIIAALGAVVFGGLQCSINNRLVKMSQVVAVTGVVEEDTSGELWIRNTGKVNLYLAGFSLGPRYWVFQPEQSILIAVNTGGDNGYPIRLGQEGWDIIQEEGGSTTLVLFLKDEFGRKWVSEIGLWTAAESGREMRLRMKTHKTSRENWGKSEPQGNPDDRAEYVKGARFIREGSR